MIHLTRNALIFSCLLGIIAGCSDPADSTEPKDCSAAGLAGCIEQALEAVDMDSACNAYLATDPWSGARATCESTAPDSDWPESGWIKTREPCITHSCVFFDETNYGTGFGVRKSAALTMDAVCVRKTVKTDTGWEITIGCGENDGTVSLTIPLRVYCDLDTGCSGEINQAVSGTITLDSLLIELRIVGGVVQEHSIHTDDLYIHIDPFGVSACDALMSDMASWIASWATGDFADFIGLIVKTEVEGAYAAFAADCP